MLFGPPHRHSTQPAGLWISWQGRPYQLPLQQVDVKVQLIELAAASVTITHDFVNDSSLTLNAVYKFPLYANAAVNAFTAQFAGRTVKGEIKEKGQAKKEYNDAVAQGTQAALLEQHTPDVFSTSIGAVPPGERVRVTLEYVSALNFDSGADALRFVLPTAIAPRYGIPPDELYPKFGHAVSLGPKQGLSIQVEVLTGFQVKKITSPSHTIGMEFGGNEGVAATVTLAQGMAILETDFVLLVAAEALNAPFAVAVPSSYNLSGATDATKAMTPNAENGTTLMVSVVPRFSLKPIRPEIVFVVDRSGSMSDKIHLVRDAMQLFLKSIPVGCAFNICSFGSNHWFLFPQSQPYSEKTLQAAQQHVAAMQSNLGGTEIYQPLEASVKQRLTGRDLELLVLTDGEVWDSETIFDYLGEVAKPDARGQHVRTFTLGIGADVSHHLVEGMARAGRGYAQIVSGINERLEPKVIRMLRAALSPHISDFHLDWAGKMNNMFAADAGSEKTAEDKADSDWEDVGEKPKPVDEKPKAPAAISLFQPELDVEATPLQTPDPKLAPLQLRYAPAITPALFPFTRFTSYIWFGPGLPVPDMVSIKGTTPDGTPLLLDVPVRHAPAHKGIDALAARAMLEDIDAQTGAQLKPLVDAAKSNMEDIARIDGTRLALAAGLMSAYTSFLAVDSDPEAAKKAAAKAKAEGADDPSAARAIESNEESDDDMGSGMWTPPPMVVCNAAPQAKGAPRPPPAPPRAAASLTPTLFSAGGGLFGRAKKRSAPASASLNRAPPGGALFVGAAPRARQSLAAPSARFGAPSGGALFGAAAPQAQQSVAAPSALFGAPPGGALFGAAAPQDEQSVAAPSALFGAPPGGALFGAAAPQAQQSVAAPSALFGAPPGGALFGAAAPQDEQWCLAPPSSLFFSSPSKDALDTADTAQGTSRRRRCFTDEKAVASPTEQLAALVALQSFAGCFGLTPELVSALGRGWKFDQLVGGQPEGVEADVWATALVLVVFERQFGALKESWELVADKAREWLVGEGADVDGVMGSAKKVLGL